FEEGAAQFELDLTVNAQDVEETVWRYLCIAQVKGTVEARQALLAVKNDPRPIMNSVYDLYAGNCTPEDVLAAGKKYGKHGRFYSHLYIGLYYEVAKDLESTDESSAESSGSASLTRSHFYILKAANEYKLDDYMWHLACVHKNLRGWH
ncbi:MAG: hypothetical protein F6K28_57635, partial [Microcoleus sp. SIO2G3]|nr:hypothetical protein [Microcoleus sp. SIO2G3]